MTQGENQNSNSFEILKKEEKYIELKFYNEEPSLLYALRDVIAEDNDVEFISVIKEHEQVNNAILMLRTKKGDPLEKLSKGLEKLDKTIQQLEKALF